MYATGGYIMISGDLFLGDFVLDEPEVFYWVRYVNINFLEDEGFRTYDLDDIYNYEKIHFDKEDADSLDDVPLEELYWLANCIGCGFSLSVTTGRFTENEKHYNVQYYSDSNIVEIRERDEDWSNTINLIEKEFEDNDEYVANYREQYEDWLEYDGEVDWEG